MYGNTGWAVAIQTVIGGLACYGAYRLGKDIYDKFKDNEKKDGEKK